MTKVPNESKCFASWSTQFNTGSSFALWIYKQILTWEESGSAPSKSLCFGVCKVEDGNYLLPSEVTISCSNWSHRFVDPS